MRDLLQNHSLILMEAAILEVLRRQGRVALHPRLMNTPLIYDALGRNELSKLYLAYGEVALEAGMPILLCAPTWRANKERVCDGSMPLSVNSDAARFMLAIKENLSVGGGVVRIGGLLGCKNDCYRPEQGLATDEAFCFHQWQVEQLAASEVDFLFAATLPNVDEALGIAKAMASCQKDYILSFVINRSGRILDGRSLWDAVSTIDQTISPPPLAYMVNCSYPAFVNPSMQPPQLFTRLIGIQANASSRDHAQLEGADQIFVDDLVGWTDAMKQLHQRYGMKILGGCCGTGIEHLQRLAVIDENRP